MNLGVGLSRTVNTFSTPRSFATLRMTKKAFRVTNQHSPVSFHLRTNYCRSEPPDYPSPLIGTGVGISLKAIDLFLKALYADLLDGKIDLLSN
jgi:hypothetical protein